MYWTWSTVVAVYRGNPDKIKEGYVITVNMYQKGEKSERERGIGLVGMDEKSL